MYILSILLIKPFVINNVEIIIQNNNNNNFLFLNILGKFTI